jgi:methyl coenzyme M reductase subunit D
VAPDPSAFAYTFPGACLMSGLGETTLRKLVNQGRLKKLAVAGRALIEGNSLRALIAGSAAGSEPVKKSRGRPRKIAA